MIPRNATNNTNSKTRLQQWRRPYVLLSWRLRSIGGGDKKWEYVRGIFIGCLTMALQTTVVTIRVISPSTRLDRRGWVRGHVTLVAACPGTFPSRLQTLRPGVERDHHGPVARPCVTSVVADALD